uniref:Uncharacterized protein n=1 Tax=Arundo donax TaxID=35708 RepID=A0A0A8ZEP8_ARUDO
MISRRALARAGAAAAAEGGVGERPWPGRSRAAARMPRDERDARTRRKEKDPAARPGRMRTRGAGEPPSTSGREVTVKSPGYGSSLRTRPEARWRRRSGGWRGGAAEEGGRRWGRRSARRETAAAR